MKIRMSVGSLALIVSFFSAAGIAAESKSTIEIGEGMAGMIGYGTLMSLSSLEKTLGHRYEGQAYPVHVRDYVRGWAFRRPLNDPQADPATAKRTDACFLRNDERVPFEGMVNLNVYPEKNGRMNCILYVLAEEDLRKVDEREGGYQRVDVTGRIEEHEFSGGRVYMYAGLPEHPDTAAADPGKYILIREYVDQVTAACDGIGREFRAEFESSTRPVAHPVVSFQAIIWEKIDQ
jgi:hypothetical protein